MSARADVLSPGAVWLQHLFGNVNPDSRLAFAVDVLAVAGAEIAEEIGQRKGALLIRQMANAVERQPTTFEIQVRREK